MATLASDTYRPVFGPSDDLFYRCLGTSAVLGTVFLVCVLLAPIRREAITSIEQLPTRFARLIVEKKPEPVAMPPADIVRPGDSQLPGEVGKKGGTNTPPAEAGPAPGPGPTDLAPGGGGQGTAPGPKGNGGAIGRARAQKLVSSQLAGATASLDRTLSGLSSSLQGVVATPGAGPARRSRSVRAARGEDQLGAVNTEVSPGTGADLGGSAVAGAWVAVGNLSGADGTGGGGLGGGSGGGVGDGTGAGSGSGTGGGGGGGGTGGYPGTGGGVGGGTGSGGGTGGVAGPGVYRSNASLLAVIQKYTAGIQYCYSNELKRDATLRGKLVVAITVAANGSVTEATVLQNTLGSERLSSCALSQIREWKFPPIPTGVTTFRAPFVFTPPN